jgi:NAD(P)-dependent dehydrogenase (short-subunit alcohol dehydrogenase family)
MGGVRQAGGRARGVVADALHAEQVQRAVQQTVDEFGRIDILVNAVGASSVRPARAVIPRGGGDMIDQ